MYTACKRNTLMKRDIRRGSATRRLAEFVKIFGALLSASVHAESRPLIYSSYFIILTMCVRYNYV